MSWYPSGEVPKTHNRAASFIHQVHTNINTLRYNRLGLISSFRGGKGKNNKFVYMYMLLCMYQFNSPSTGYHDFWLLTLFPLHKWIYPLPRALVHACKTQTYTADMPDSLTTSTWHVCGEYFTSSGKTKFQIQVLSQPKLPTSTHCWITAQVGKTWQKNEWWRNTKAATSRRADCG